LRGYGKLKYFKNVGNLEQKWRIRGLGKGE